MRDFKFLTLAAVNIGGALEWYEIGIFVAWPLIIQQKGSYFDAPIAETLNASAVLIAVAIALASGGARAIGGWFFGRKGDQEGRKIAFPLTVLFATFPSWCLALLSFFLSYEVWFNYSTIIFAVAKFFQGMPAGGELPGAICYLSENTTITNREVIAVRANRRYMCSYAMVGPQVGLALSAIICLLLKLVFPLDFLLNQGWRFVFLLSGLMGIGGFIMRKHLHETKAFINRKLHHQIKIEPLRDVFRNYRDRIVCAFMFSIFEVVCFSVISVVPFLYSKADFGLSQRSIIIMSLFSSFLCIIFLPLIGFISSKYIRFPWLKASAWSVIPVSFLLYFFVLQNWFLLTAAMNVLLIFLFSAQAAILPSILAELFPVEVRYTGIAFSFNICDGVLWNLITSASFYLLSNGASLFVLFVPFASILFLIYLKTEKFNTVKFLSRC